MKNVILINGKAGAGKDTLCEVLTETLTGKVRRIAFADPLKEGCSKIFGIPLHYFYDRDLKDAADLTEYGYPGKTPRWLLQFVGTEMFRNKFGSEIWVQTAANKINNDDEHDVFIVTDCRFQNELLLGEHLKDANMTWLKVERPNNPTPVFTHASEQELKALFDQTIINDSTIDALREQVEGMPFVEKIRRDTALKLRVEVETAMLDAEVNYQRRQQNEEA